jgi:hypothetical protein
MATPFAMASLPGCVRSHLEEPCHKPLRVHPLSKFSDLLSVFRMIFEDEIELRVGFRTVFAVPEIRSIPIPEKGIIGLQSNCLLIIGLQKIPFVCGIVGRLGRYPEITVCVFFIGF